MKASFRSLFLVLSLVVGLAWLSRAQVSIERGNTFGPLNADTLCLDAANRDACLSRAAADILQLDAGDSFNLNPAGVRLSSDADGAITFLGLGNGTDEDLTLNLDDTANTIVASSSTGVTQLTWTEMVQAVTRDGIITTSTDGGLLANNTASTAGVPVQQSPRLRLRSNVWNTTAVAANNTDDWWIESVPVSGTTPSGLLRFGSSLNGAAATHLMTLRSTDGKLTIGGLALNAAGNIAWAGRSILTSPADGKINLSNNAETLGFGFDFTTDALASFRTRAQTGYATVQALGYLADQSSITAGAHATVVNTGEIRTVVYKATVTSTTCLAPFAAAALTADCTVATLPAKTKIIAVYADTTAGWTCSGTCTGTKVMVLGKSAGGTEYIASNTVATSAVTRGLADAELGTELVRAARIQDGAIIANAGGVWTGTTTVTARFTSGTGNWGDAATTFVNAGSTSFYIETVVYP